MPLLRDSSCNSVSVCRSSCYISWKIPTMMKEKMYMQNLFRLGSYQCLFYTRGKSMTGESLSSGWGPQFRAVDRTHGNRLQEDKLELLLG